MLFCTLACGPDREQLAKQQAAKHVVEDAEARAQALEAEAEALEAKVDRMRAESETYERRAWANVFQGGGLGPRASLWIKDHAEAGGSIEKIIRQGPNIEAFTKAIAPRLNEATDDTRAVEPFAVEVEDYRAKPAIAAMARKKELGLVELGFGELGHTSEAEAEDWGYLVAWYHRGAVVGFVYHSTQRLELDALETETASLVEMMRAELPKPSK